MRDEVFVGEIHGRVVVSFAAKDQREKKKLMKTLRHLGAMDEEMHVIWRGREITNIRAASAAEAKTFWEVSDKEFAERGEHTVFVFIDPLSYPGEPYSTSNAIGHA